MLPDITFSIIYSLFTSHHQSRRHLCWPLRQLPLQPPHLLLQLLLRLLPVAPLEKSDGKEKSEFSIR
jgi:hypothetical protein